LGEKKYNAADITKKLGLGKTTILRWEKEGKIPEAKRDQLGWRYWSEKEFNDILAIAEGRVVEKSPQAELNLDIRPAEDKFLRARLLPELSKDKVITEANVLAKYNGNNFREVKFGTVAILAALVFFGSSSAASVFADGFKNSWFAFERGFEFSTARLASSGDFLGAKLTPLRGQGKIIDEWVLYFFRGSSNFLAQKGFEIKSFYKEGGMGLWEGFFVLRRKAVKDYFEFGENIKLAQARSAEASEILANFARDSLNADFAYAEDGAPDMLSAAAGINFSLGGLIGNSKFVRELVLDWEFIKPDVKALPLGIFNFYAERIGDAIFAAGDLFEIGSYLAIDVAQRGTFAFNNLGGKLALAQPYAVVEFLIGQ